MRDSDGDPRGPRTWSVASLVGRSDRRRRLGRRHPLCRRSNKCTRRRPSRRGECISWSASRGRIAKALRPRSNRRPTESDAVGTPSPHRRRTHSCRSAPSVVSGRRHFVGRDLRSPGTRPEGSRGLGATAPGGCCTQSIALPWLGPRATRAGDTSQSRGRSPIVRATVIASLGRTGGSRWDLRAYRRAC